MFFKGLGFWKYSLIILNWINLWIWFIDLWFVFFREKGIGFGNFVCFVILCICLLRIMLFIIYGDGISFVWFCSFVIDVFVGILLLKFIIWESGNMDSCFFYCLWLVIFNFLFGFGFFGFFELLLCFVLNVKIVF